MITKNELLELYKLIDAMNQQHVIAMNTLCDKQRNPMSLITPDEYISQWKVDELISEKFQTFIWECELAHAKVQAAKVKYQAALDVWVEQELNSSQEESNNKESLNEYVCKF